jgi:hypothetical protein
VAVLGRPRREAYALRPSQSASSIPKIVKISQ